MIGENPKGVLAALFDFSFKQFITGQIIRILYFLSVLMAALGYLMFVIGSFQVSAGVGAMMMLFVGPIMFLVWVIYARVILELMMVIFRISEDVSGVRAFLKQKVAEEMAEDES